MHLAGSMTKGRFHNTAVIGPLSRMASKQLTMLEMQSCTCQHNTIHTTQNSCCQVEADAGLPCSAAQEVQDGAQGMIAGGEWSFEPWHKCPGQDVGQTEEQ